MPLNLSIRPFEQLLVNGALIVNGDRRARLKVLNEARIARGVMSVEHITTPLRELYVALQYAYAGEEEYQADALSIAERALINARATLGESKCRALLDEAMERVPWDSPHRVYTSVRRCIELVEGEPLQC